MLEQGRRLLFGLLVLGAGATLGAAPAEAQPVTRRPERTLRVDSIPPLPDVLRIYGDTLVVRVDLPDLAPPPGALQLTLGEAVRLALARNPGLGIDVAEAERARNDIALGRAAFLPTADATAQAGGSGSAAFFGDSTSRGSSGSFSTSGDVTVGYTIFDAGRSATLRRLRIEATRFGLTAEAEAEALAFAVTAAYLDVIRQEGVAVALAEAVEVSADRLRIEQAEVEIGTAAAIDAALALADLNADRAALLRQALALTESRAELGALLALPEPEAVAPTDTLALGPEPDVAALSVQARGGNRRVRALEVAQLAAREAVNEVRAEYLPTLRLLAGAGLTAQDRGLFPVGEPTLGPDLRYGFTATLPLLDGGDRRRRVQNARIRVRQAELATEDELAGLRADVARLGAAVRGYRQLAALEAQNRVVARQNVRVALAQFQFGLITPIDLRQVQLSLFDAEVRFVDAVFQARRAEAELRFLAGELLPPGALDGVLDPRYAGGADDAP